VKEALIFRKKLKNRKMFYKSKLKKSFTFINNFSSSLIKKKQYEQIFVDADSTLTI